MSEIAIDGIAFVWLDAGLMLAFGVVMALLTVTTWVAGRVRRRLSRREK